MSNVKDTALAGAFSRTDDGIVINSDVSVEDSTAEIGEDIENLLATDRLVYSACKAAGIPGAHQAYPEGKAPKPPFFVYELDSGGEVFADDENLCRFPRYRVELIERQADQMLESSLLIALKREFGAVRLYEDWSDSEHARIVSYYFTVTN